MILTVGGLSTTITSIARSQPSLGRLVVLLVAVLLASSSSSSSTATANAWPINTDQEHEALLLGGNKKIVFLAGPHNSAYYSVYKFVSKWSKAKEEGHVRTYALTNWRWGGNDIHKLITEPEEENEEIWEKLQSRFDEPDINGVIVGSAFFDQIGPSAKHDALSAMKKIIEKLGVSKEDVLVIEHYRTPRFDQFVSMWKHADGEYEESTYEDWLCDTHNKPDEQTKRLDMLGARTNPLGASLAYLNEGWEVKLLETTGMDSSDINIVQVVVTQILQGRTVNGLIASHEYVKNHDNEGERDFVEFNDTDIALAEELFRYRDCAYQPKLMPFTTEKTLDVLYNHSLFSTCDGSKTELYQRLMEHPQIMYSALLRQLKCPNHDVDFAGHTTIAQALGYEKMSEAEKKEAVQTTIQVSNKSTSSGSTSGAAGASKPPSATLILMQMVTAALFGYQVFKINLARPLRKPEPPASRRPSAEIEFEYEDPQLQEDYDVEGSEMVKLTASTGKGN
ncbi:unnamed protein product [Cylindrotheca closterium]|uniref:Uncharacterized protein n=1 Tax=Cylindrotheca closterium TaxID=2856 RepID=A0AAD2G5P1_9STRA|nr:unnamed protein product [Cylindrotheca closterium]